MAEVTTTGTADQKRPAIPQSVQSKLLAQRIQKTCKTVAMALELMSVSVPANSHDDGAWEEAWFATLQVCGKLRDCQEAVRIVRVHAPHSDRCRALAIGICGRCRRLDQALSLLLPDDPISTPAPYNAAIAACGLCRDWKEALRIVREQMPPHMVHTLTCNAVLTALAKSQRGDEALEFLRLGFSKWRATPDRGSYHHTVAALLAQGNRIEEAIRLVLVEMRADTNPDVLPTLETYGRLISTVVAKRNVVQGDPVQEDRYNSLLRQLQQASQDALLEDSKKKTRKRPTETDEASTAKRAKLSHNDNHEDNHNHNDNNFGLPWEFNKWGLSKRGKGKTARWELGVLKDDDGEAMVVALHPNRNPSKNGIQLWFYREDAHGKLQKLGYLLMINTPNYDHPGGGNSSAWNGTSQFLGLRVTDDDRRKGLAKTFVALWLQCCLDANLQPTTGKMNKPLLCLVLQHAYKFTPVAQSGGVRARLLPSEAGSVVRLTTESNAVKNLAGALTPRDVQEQNVQFVSPTEAAPGGRPIVVGGLLQAPAKEDLAKCIVEVLQCRWKLSPGIARSEATSTTMVSTDPTNGTNGIAAEKPLTLSRVFLGV